MKMIEIIARAMVANDSGPEGSTLFDIHWSEFGEGYLANARAAIAAMQIPTEAMVDDGIWALPAHSECVDVVEVYNAMIAAALPEVTI